jgi:hypothetical protein
MEFEPQNDFERSLVRATSDAALRPQFYRDFCAATVYVVQAGTPPVPAGETTLREGQTLRLQSWEFNGTPHLPLFSSLARLRAVLSEEASYLAMNALELLRLTRGAELVLNPGSQYGKEFTAAEVESILDGSIGAPQPYVAGEDTRVLLGQPAEPPTKLVEALRRLFAERPQVTRAWLALMSNPARDENAHTLVALEVSGDWDAIAADVGVVAQSLTLPDPPLDLIRFEGGQGLDGYFTRSEPFFQRG